MTCRGFQYEEGKEYHEERALCCDTGFHACEYPLDCFKYYEPADSVYHEVEQTGDIDKSEGDSKVAPTEIKIGAKIGMPGLVQAAIEYTSKRCEKKAENQQYRRPWSIQQYRKLWSIFQHRRRKYKLCRMRKFCSRSSRIKCKS